MFNLTIKSLTGHASFVLKDGKIYIYVEDINSFETVRLITAADKYNFIIENYNAGNTGYETALEKFLRNAMEDA